MLYIKLVSRLEKLNDWFDEAVIDSTLEYGEALSDIRRHHPEIIISAEDDRPP